MIQFILALIPTILLTCYSQLITKWRVNKLFGQLETPLPVKERILIYMLDPYIISAYACSFFAAIAWLFVMERFPVSIAFPTYVGVLFVVVLLGSAFLLREHISVTHLLGIALILVGVAVASHANG